MRRRPDVVDAPLKSPPGSRAPRALTAIEPSAWNRFSRTGNVNLLLAALPHLRVGGHARVAVHEAAEVELAAAWLPILPLKCDLNLARDR